MCQCDFQHVINILHIFGLLILLRPTKSALCSEVSLGRRTDSNFIINCFVIKNSNRHQTHSRNTSRIFTQIYSIYHRSNLFRPVKRFAKKTPYSNNFNKNPYQISSIQVESIRAANKHLHSLTNTPNPMNNIIVCCLITLRNMANRNLRFFSFPCNLTDFRA